MIEGQIFLRSDKQLTPEEILAAEQYINTTLASILYANRQIGIRVHINPYVGMTAEQIFEYESKYDTQR